MSGAMAPSENVSLRAAPLGGDETIAFTFEGRAIQGRHGESLAAALTAAGERTLRLTRDGRGRGIFCGMGVCQECLVEIDGKPGLRACMTKLEQPISVRRQAVLPQAMPAPSSRTSASEPLTPEIFVLGGGAGGLNAAIAAAEAGAKVLLVDERPVAGGQFFKQRLDSPAVAEAIPDDGQFAGGRALIARARATGVTLMAGCQVWGAFEPLDLMIFDGSTSILCQPQRLIVAAGAYERGLPVPGWTLPGIMATGAAQTLLRSYGVLAGKRLLIAGNGPLNLQVGIELARAGAQILTIAELAPAPGLHSLPALADMAASTPDLLRQGWRYRRELARRNIPLSHGHVLASVEKIEGGLRAKLAPWPRADIWNRGPSMSMPCDGLRLHAVERDSARVRLPPSLRFHARPSGDRARWRLPHQHRHRLCRGRLLWVGRRARRGSGRYHRRPRRRSLPRLWAERRTAAGGRGGANDLCRHRRSQAGLWQLFAARASSPSSPHRRALACRCQELARAEIEAGIAPARNDRRGVARDPQRHGPMPGPLLWPTVAALSAAQRGEALRKPDTGLRARG